MNTQKFRTEYTSILRAFLESQQEQYLLKAADLGRQLVLANVPPEDIAEIHEHAVHTIAGESPDKTLLDSAGYISAPLMELLMAYGLAFREWLDSLKQAEKKLLDYQSQLKSLASKLVQTEERERRRIAMALHDSIGQELVIAKLMLESSRESVSNSDVLTSLNKVCEIIGWVIEDTHLLTFELSDPILHELGLTAAVERYLCEEIEQKNGIQFELHCDEPFNNLNEDIRTALFRNVRELLLNVVRHAKADNVKVRISRSDARIHVSVEDDGVGFNPAELAPTPLTKAGFGLFSCRELLEQLGGHLEIESEPGRGSKITLIVPMIPKATPNPPKAMS